ncbi:MAG: AEC family transporter [Frisingicoccus sp.]
MGCGNGALTTVCGLCSASNKGTACMIGFILAKKILSLFLMMVMGAILVRAKVIRVEDSRSISIISLYLITPCAIFSAFQMTYTPQILKSLILAAVSGAHFTYYHDSSDEASGKAAVIGCG